MKPFLLKILLFLLGSTSLIYLFFVNINEGFVEDFYPKFSSPLASSMILGSSRALQGLKPYDIYLDLPCDTPILNFAFTMTHSPYGELYFRSIQKKLDPSSKNGLYILEINPFILSVKKGNKELREKTSRLSNQIMYNQSPNIEYILKNYQDPLYTLYIDDSVGNEVYSKYGWFNFDVTVTEAQLKEKIDAGIKSYQKVFANSELSDYRLDYLKKTVNYLKSYGDVILLRMPLTKEMYTLENRYYPQFDQIIGKVSNEKGIRFINLVDSGYKYNFRDAHHIQSNSATYLSQDLNKEIKNDTNW